MFSIQFGLLHLLQPLSELIEARIIMNSISATVLNTHTHITSPTSCLKLHLAKGYLLDYRYSLHYVLFHISLIPVLISDCLKEF